MSPFDRIHFGPPGEEDPNWRDYPDNDQDEDDELQAATDPDVIRILGFDPLEFTGLGDAGFGQFEESKHPRGSGGKFSEKGGGDPLLKRFVRKKREQVKPVEGDVTVYHGTIKTALDSIAEKGLIPKGGRGADEWAAEFQGVNDFVLNPGNKVSVYMSTDMEEAQGYGEQAAELNGVEAVLLEIKIPADEYKKHARKDSASGAVQWKGTVKSEWIKRALVALPPENEGDSVEYVLSRKMHDAADEVDLFAVFFVRDSTEDAGFGQFEESKHPRGHGGKFSEKPGGGGVKSDPLLTRWGRKHSLETNLGTPASDLFDAAIVKGHPSLEEFVGSLPANELKALQEAVAKDKTSKSTKELHQKPGTKSDPHAPGQYTAEREALHQKILQKVFTPEAVKAATPAEGEKPLLTLLGGRGGSGKSWLMSKDGPVDENKAIYINPDDFKEALPEYEGWNSGATHFESLDLTHQASAIAKSLGLNVILDQTMGYPPAIKNNIEIYTAAGYEVSGHYMFASPKTASRRAVKRLIEVGRYVPPEYTLTSLSNERAFDQSLPSFKEWTLYSNDEEKFNPKLVAQGRKA